jgi:hypothetical protein
MIEEAAAAASSKAGLGQLWATGPWCRRIVTRLAAPRSTAPNTKAAPIPASFQSNRSLLDATTVVVGAGSGFGTILVCVELEGTAHAPISWCCLAVAVPVATASANTNGTVSDVRIRLYMFSLLSLPLADITAK